jgi:hypothetical protein
MVPVSTEHVNRINVTGEAHLLPAPPAASLLVVAASRRIPPTCRASTLDPWPETNTGSRSRSSDLPRSIPGTVSRLATGLARMVLAKCRYRRHTHVRVGEG